MKTVTYTCEKLTPLNNLKKLANSDDLLFFDIETTGLSRQNNIIYLIGCGYYSKNGLEIVQWFAENESEELLVLNSFIDFSSSFTHIVNYNGKSFDIPFTSERMHKYGLSMPEFVSIDLYTYVKPLKHILSLNDLTQKSVERFLNIERKDLYNGGELISVYKKYIKNAKNSAELLDMLLLHNYEDVLNMHSIVNILDYSELYDMKPLYSEYKLNEYRDYSGNQKNELILFGSHGLNILPRSFNTFKNTETGSYNMAFSSDGPVSIRIPVTYDSLYYFLPNYKDYYYLPSEDMCILKSMGGGVLKENRINATKETCRIGVSDQFIPVPPGQIIQDVKLFKKDYKSKASYLRLSDLCSLSNEALDELLYCYYKYMFT